MEGGRLDAFYCSPHRRERRRRALEIPSIHRLQLDGSEDDAWRAYGLLLRQHGG